MFERERQEEKIELKLDSELAEEPDTDPIDDRFLQEQYANRQHERPKIASKYDTPAPRNSIVHAPADKSQSLILAAIIGGISGAIIVLVCFICIQENSQKTKEQPAAKFITTNMAIESVHLVQPWAPAALAVLAGLDHP